MPAKKKKGAGSRQRIIKIADKPVLRLRKKRGRIEFFVKFAYAFPTSLVMWTASLITITLTVLQAARIMLWKERHARLQEWIKKLWIYQLKMHSYLTSVNQDDEDML